MITHSHSKGFTITEMSFAMTGLSVLMMVLLLVAFNITSLYNKGIVLKAANQTGRVIGEDVQRALREASSASVAEQDGVLTRLCTGKISYIWSVQSTNGPVITNNYSPGSGGERIGFARVLDQGGQLCQTSSPSGLPVLNGTGNLAATEMLDPTLSLRYSVVDGVGAGINYSLSADGKLSVFRYTIASASADNQEFIADGSRCEGGKAGEFCALNTFTVTSYSRYR